MFSLDKTNMLIRNISYTFLTLIFLVSTTGISISMHLCKGILVSTSINKETKSCCDGAGGCCENETFVVAVDDDFVSPVHENTIQTIEIDLFLPLFFVVNFFLDSKEESAATAFYDSSPPAAIQPQLALLQTYLC